MMKTVPLIALLAVMAMPAAAQSSADGQRPGGIPTLRLTPAIAVTPQVKAAMDRATNCVFYSPEEKNLRRAAEEAVTRPAGRPGSAEWSAALKIYRPYLLARRTQRRCIEALDLLRLRGIDHLGASVTVAPREREILSVDVRNLFLEWLRHSGLDQMILWRLAGEPGDDPPDPLPFDLLAARTP